MLFLLNHPATPDQITQAQTDLGGYIKFVVDITKKIITLGGVRHVQGEELLLSHGSRQSDLWGGGIDWETKAIDFESMINIRPNQNNSSREVLSESIRTAITKIVKTFLPLP